VLQVHKVLLESKVQSEHKEQWAHKVPLVLKEQ
jgi:hypothetical protein